MASNQSQDKRYIECKGCSFLIEDKKLVLHLNNPKTSGCKPYYDKSDYNVALNFWIKSEVQTNQDLKVSKRSLLECRGCKTNIEDFKLILHLNNPKTNCKDVYSKIEHTVLFEIWSNNFGDGPFRFDDVVDVTNKNALRCKGCLTQYGATEIRLLEEHIESHPNCERHFRPEDMKYIKSEFWRFDRWTSWLQNSPKTFKLLTAELSNDDIDRIDNIDRID